MFEATFYNDSVEINEQQVLPQVTQRQRQEGAWVRTHHKYENNKWQALDDHNNERVIQEGGATWSTGI